MAAEEREWLSSAERLEYEALVADRDRQIVDLMAQNAELVKINWHLSEILRTAARLAAEEVERG